MMLCPMQFAPLPVSSLTLLLHVLHSAVLAVLDYLQLQPFQPPGVLD